MKKTKVKPQVSDGKKFLNALHSLFEAKDRIEVFDRLEECQLCAKTLTHIRALHSWVVCNHGLSVMPLHEMQELGYQVMLQWQDMVADQLLTVLSHAAYAEDLRMWRVLYALAPSSKIGISIREEMDNFSRRVPKKTSAREYARYGCRGSYPEVHLEVLGLARGRNSAATSSLLLF